MSDTTYAEVAELKPWVGIAADDVSADDLLQQKLNTAAEQVDGATRGVRTFGEAFSASAEQTRTFSYDYSGWATIDDAISITAVSLDGVELAAEKWEAYPYQDDAGKLPITALLIVGACCPLGGAGQQVGAGRIEVTGTWGYCAEENRPALVKEATLVQAAYLFSRIARSDAPSDEVDGVHKSVAALLKGLVRHSYVV